jgi:3-methyladenine DNA glycosylase Tag
MERFAKVLDRAAKRHGGESQLTGMLPAIRTARALAGTSDDRWLAQMTRCVFQAGFVWRVVDNKWDDFEDVFFGFPPERIVMLSPDQIDRFAQKPRIIRNRQKVLTNQDNARFILDTARDHGSFGRFVGGWPSTDLIDLFGVLKKGGSRLGGTTGQRVLRNMGKDTFIVTGDVVRCLVRSGLAIGDNPTSQRESRLIQEAFNRWHDETDLPYSHLSRIAALSV